MSGRSETSREICAGAGLGLFCGFLVGLATSDIVAAVTGGLVALLGSFLGLKEDAKSETSTSPGTRWRVAAFGLCGALAIIVGIAFRTHRILAPSVSAQIQELTAAGFEAEAARALVVYQQFGLRSSNLAADSGPVQRSASSSLFANRADECSQLAARRLPDAAERAQAFTNMGGPWKTVAEAAVALPAPQQGPLLDALWSVACAE